MQLCDVPKYVDEAVSVSAPFFRLVSEKCHGSGRAAQQW
jgi:hypothetical protein